MRGAFLAVLLLLPNTADAQRRTSASDIALGAALVAAYWIDAAQTRYAQAHGAEELNPLLGRHPSPAAITLLLAGQATAELYVASRLPHPWRSLWLVGALALELATGPVYNVRAGWAVRF